MGLLTFNSGHLSAVEPSRKDYKTSTIIRSLKSSFVDRNKNTKFDQGEKRESLPIAMISESEKSKIVVFSDATMISDPILVNPGNQLIVTDTIRWAVGQASYMGKVNTEEDVSASVLRRYMSMHCLHICEFLR